MTLVSDDENLKITPEERGLLCEALRQYIVFIYDCSGSELLNQVKEYKNEPVNYAKGSKLSDIKASATAHATKVSMTHDLLSKIENHRIMKS